MKARERGREGGREGFSGFFEMNCFLPRILKYGRVGSAAPRTIISRACGGFTCELFCPSRLCLGSHPSQDGL
jgi:hypothetical protein